MLAWFSWYTRLSLGDGFWKALDEGRNAKQTWELKALSLRRNHRSVREQVGREGLFLAGLCQRSLLPIAHQCGCGR